MHCLAQRAVKWVVMCHHTTTTCILTAVCQVPVDEPILPCFVLLLFPKLSLSGMSDIGFSWNISPLCHPTISKHKKKLKQVPTVMVLTTSNAVAHKSLAICRPSGCTVASGIVGIIVVGICNCSLMRTSKCTCLVFGVSTNLDPG